MNLLKTYCANMLYHDSEESINLLIRQRTAPSEDESALLRILRFVRHRTVYSPFTTVIAANHFLVDLTGIEPTTS